MLPRAPTCIFNVKFTLELFVVIDTICPRACPVSTGEELSGPLRSLAVTDVELLNILCGVRFPVFLLVATRIV